MSTFGFPKYRPEVSSLPLTESDHFQTSKGEKGERAGGGRSVQKRERKWRKVNLADTGQIESKK